MMNFASSLVGAKVISCSSEKPSCEASNILLDDDSKIWLTSEELPQWIVIDFRSVKARIHKNTAIIRTIGWNCWHSYSTNPRSVRIHVSADSKHYKVWDTFEADVDKKHQPKIGAQLFCCQPINIYYYPYLTFEILSTFGGQHTYCNQIYCFSDEISSTSFFIPSFESPHSSFVSPASPSIATSSKENSSFLLSPAGAATTFVNGHKILLEEDDRVALELRRGTEDDGDDSSEEEEEEYDEWKEAIKKSTEVSSSSDGDGEGLLSDDSLSWSPPKQRSADAPFNPLHEPRLSKVPVSASVGGFTVPTPDSLPNSINEMTVLEEQLDKALGLTDELSLPSSFSDEKELLEEQETGSEYGSDESYTGENLKVVEKDAFKKVGRSYSDRQISPEMDQNLMHPVVDVGPLAKASSLHYSSSVSRSLPIANPQHHLHGSEKESASNRPSLSPSLSEERRFNRNHRVQKEKISKFDDARGKEIDGTCNHDFPFAETMAEALSGSMFLNHSNGSDTHLKKKVPHRSPPLSYTSHSDPGTHFSRTPLGPCTGGNTDSTTFSSSSDEELVSSFSVPLTGRVKANTSSQGVQTSIQLPDRRVDNSARSVRSVAEQRFDSDKITPSSSSPHLSVLSRTSFSLNGEVKMNHIPAHVDVGRSEIDDSSVNRKINDNDGSAEIPNLLNKLKLSASDSARPYRPGSHLSKSERRNKQSPGSENTHGVVPQSENFGSESGQQHEHLNNTLPTRIYSCHRDKDTSYCEFDTPAPLKPSSSAPLPTGTSSVSLFSVSSQYHSPPFPPRLKSLLPPFEGLNSRSSQLSSSLLFPPASDRRLSLSGRDLSPKQRYSDLISAAEGASAEGGVVPTPSERLKEFLNKSWKDQIEKERETIAKSAREATKQSSRRFSEFQAQLLHESVLSSLKQEAISSLMQESARDTVVKEKLQCETPRGRSRARDTNDKLLRKKDNMMSAKKNKDVAGFRMDKSDDLKALLKQLYSLILKKKLKEAQFSILQSQVQEDTSDSGEEDEEQLD
jgi:hypothetical protein